MNRLKGATLSLLAGAALLAAGFAAGALLLGDRPGPRIPIAEVAGRLASGSMSRSDWRSMQDQLNGVDLRAYAAKFVDVFMAQVSLGWTTEYLDGTLFAIQPGDATASKEWPLTDALVSLSSTATCEIEDRYRSATDEQKVELLRVLAAIGGKRELDIIAENAMGGSRLVTDEAKALLYLAARDYGVVWPLYQVNGGVYELPHNYAMIMLSYVSGCEAAPIQESLRRVRAKLGAAVVDEVHAELDRLRVSNRAPYYPN